MCLLPLPNANFDGLAYKKGVVSFDCGACPECLGKRSSRWALRSVYEAKQHSHNCMITLTYDSFLRDSKGNLVLDSNGQRIENPVDPDLKVNRRHVQLFIKRLRKWYSTVSDEKIKYIACAEYGSRTHRAHYHVLLFGVKFPDMHYYKKSKRGHAIFMSKTLSRLWSYGICTIDSEFVGPAVARYCTKYCAKSRSEETFMLCSQKIGFVGLLRDFNGLSYFVDGREYPVPRFIWEYYITRKYQRKYLYLKNAPLLSPKYVNRNRDLSFSDSDFEYERSCAQRRFYRRVRDKDSLYIRYLDYWRRKGELFELHSVPPRTRILQLPESKYHFYKVAALDCLDRRRVNFTPYIAPGSLCVSAYACYLSKFGLSLAPLSRPNRASDTKLGFYDVRFRTRHVRLCKIFDSPSLFEEKKANFS